MFLYAAYAQHSNSQSSASKPVEDVLANLGELLFGDWQRPVVRVAQRVSQVVVAEREQDPLDLWLARLAHVLAVHVAIPSLDACYRSHTLRTWWIRTRLTAALMHTLTTSKRSHPDTSQMLAPISATSSSMTPCRSSIVNS